jgi:prepilin-type N-terminal cleavage/methylation domain-containing protein
MPSSKQHLSEKVSAMQASLERLHRRRDEMGDEGGFTLIELLIVIVILGILAAIVVFAVQNLTTSASQASCGSDYKTVETAVEAYKAQMGNYPSGSGGVAGTLPNTDTDAGNADAAAAGGELLTGSETAPLSGVDSSGTATKNDVSPTGGNVGPWLKDVPSNGPGGNHYTIGVSNDGLGTITVTPAAPVGNPNPCANAH